MREALRPIATALADAHRSGALLPPMTPPTMPENLDEAYEIQEATVSAAGLDTGGWKIGCTSRASQVNLGSNGPTAGRMFAGRIFRSGATLSDVRTDMLLIEAEFAFRLGADLPPREADYEREEVEAVISDLYPAIELVQSRFAEMRMPILGIVTDMSGAGCLILGESVPDWREIDLAAQSVRLIGPPGVLASGYGRDVLGHPLEAMTWLANSLSRRGIGLRADEVVTTGTCFAPPMVPPGTEVTADFGALGRCQVRFAQVDEASQRG